MDNIFAHLIQEEKEIIMEAASDIIKTIQIFIIF